MPRILIIDNYDSFTFNLAHYLEEIPGVDVVVVRNNEIAVEEASAYDAIVISPGPGLPSEAGITLTLIRKLAGVKPILGICLGHQAITEVFGGKLRQLNEVIHGLERNCVVTELADPIFKDVPAEFIAGRYHSWVPDEASFPTSLSVLATDDDRCIMMLRHKEFNIYGMQFHPESIMTPQGKKLLRNWVDGMVFE
jgi:anthranilate synthase component 2